MALIAEKWRTLAGSLVANTAEHAAALKRGEAGIDGERGVVIGIRKQPGANTVTLTRDLEAVPDGQPAALRRVVVVGDV